MPTQERQLSGASARKTARNLKHSHSRLTELFVIANRQRRCVDKENLKVKKLRILEERI
jgi:hypothetical protein